jgi:hypothetical protein
MLLQLVPPRLVLATFRRKIERILRRKVARLFIPSDGMREERMQDLRNSIVGAIPYAAAWPGPFRGLKKKMIRRNFWSAGYEPSPKELTCAHRFGRLD